MGRLAQIRYINWYAAATLRCPSGDEIERPAGRGYALTLVDEEPIEI
jgi:hypothetical protein